MNLLFVGASGYGNIGDDAYKVVFLEWFGDAHCVRFDSPYPDVTAVDWADIVVVGGGGLVYCNESEHFAYMTAYLDRAKRNNTPTAFLSCGVQLRCKDPQQAVKVGEEVLEPWGEHLRRAKLLTFRSHVCVDVVQKISGGHPNLHYAPDAAYALRKSNLQIGPERSTLIIPTPSGAKSPKFQEAINNIRKDERVIVASFSRDDDETVRAIAARFSEHGNDVDRLRLSVQDALALVSNASRVITCRYHGTVLARACGLEEDQILTLDGRYKSIVEQRPNDIKDSHMHRILFEQFIRSQS